MNQLDVVAKALEPEIIQPAARAKEVSPVRKRWEKKKNRDKAPLGAAQLSVDEAGSSLVK